MRQLDFIEAGKLEWRDVDEPRLEGDAEAIVRPVTVATCDLDRGFLAGVVPVPEPFPFGHEGIAEVAEVGDGVREVVPGELVSVPFQISCGECGQCRRGHSGNCESVPRMSTYGLPIGPDYGGFLSDAVKVPFADAMLVPVPEDVDPKAIASLSDNIPDAWRTVGPQLDAEPGATVLICGGAGSIPLYAAAIAVALGAQRVDFAGGSPEDRELAERLGANLVDEEFPKRLGPYPITVDAGASHESLHCALRSTEPDGICTSIGIYYEPETPIPLLEVYTKGIWFHTGRPHAREVMPRILELVQAGSFAPELVTREQAAWDDAVEALVAHRGKLVISRD
jgi:alcohol dehydrogenase